MNRLTKTPLGLLCFTALACNSPEVAGPPKGESTHPSEESGPLELMPPGIHEQTTLLPDGTELRFTMVVPSGYDPAVEAPLVVSLHYGGEVTPFYGRHLLETVMEPGLRELQAVMIAPDSLSQGWSSSRNEEAVLWLTRSALQSYGLDARRVLLVGFSMGAMGTWEIANRHQELFTAAIAIAGRPGGEQEWRIPIHALHSTADEVFPIAPTRRHIRQLQDAGANAEFLEVHGIGHHETDEYAKPLESMVPWLQDAWR